MLGMVFITMLKMFFCTKIQIKRRYRNENIQQRKIFEKIIYDSKKR